jgi:hypothetical protein
MPDGLVVPDVQSVDWSASLHRRHRTASGMLKHTYVVERVNITADDLRHRSHVMASVHVRLAARGAPGAGSDLSSWASVHWSHARTFLAAEHPSQRRCG